MNQLCKINFESNWNQIVFTIFRLIWNQTDVHLDPNRSENGKYNLIPGNSTKMRSRFFSVFSETLLTQYPIQEFLYEWNKTQIYFRLHWDKIIVIYCIFFLEHFFSNRSFWMISKYYYITLKIYKLFYAIMSILTIPYTEKK